MRPLPGRNVKRLHWLVAEEAEMTKQEVALSLATANEASGDGAAVVRPWSSITLNLEAAAAAQVASQLKERNLTL